MGSFLRPFDAGLVAGYLTVASLALWSLAIITGDLSIGALGLASSLSPLYYLALIALFAAFLVSMRLPGRPYLRYAHVLLLVAYLFLTPALVEPSPRFRAFSSLLGFSDYIARNHVISPADIWYHNWPGGSIIAYLITAISSGIDQFALVRLFPFFAELLYFFPVYALLKYTLRSERLVFAGVWIFFALNFVNQDYFSPQAIAYLIFLVLLAIIVKLLVDGDYRVTKSYLFVILVLYAFLCVTHMLSSLLLIIILAVALLVVRRDRPGGAGPRGSRRGLIEPFTIGLRNKNLLSLLVIFVITFGLWTLYGANFYLQWNFKGIMFSAFNMASFLAINFGSRVAGSPAHQLITRLMIVTAVVSGGMALLICVVGVLRKTAHTVNNLILTVMLAAIGLAALFYPYGGEMIIRVFLFSIPLLTIFLAQGLATRLKTVVVLFVLLLTLAHVVVHYGNEVYDYVPPGELTSFSFLYDHANYGPGDLKYIVSGYPLYDYRFMENNYVMSFADLIWDGQRYYDPKVLNQTGDYVLLSRSDLVQYDYYFNNVSDLKTFQSNLADSFSYNKLYSNPDTSIYGC